MKLPSQALDNTGFAGINLISPMGSIVTEDFKPIDIMCYSMAPCYFGCRFLNIFFLNYRTHTRYMSQYLGLILLLLCPMGLSGCANLIASQTTQLTEQLSTTIVNNDDPDTVAAALPTLLILIESFTKEDPSSELLQTAAKLHSAYASGFVKDSARKQGLNRKALGYAKRAACQYQSNYCGITALNFKE